MFIKSVYTSKQYQSRCIICERPIPDMFWVCGSCKKHKDPDPEQCWDLTQPFTQWPKWARYLKQQEQNRRRRQNLDDVLQDVD